MNPHRRREAKAARRRRRLAEETPERAKLRVDRKRRLVEAGAKKVHGS